MASRKPNPKRGLSSTHKKLLTTELRKLLKNKKTQAFLRSPKGVVTGLVVVIALAFFGIYPNDFGVGSGPSSSSTSSAPRAKGDYALHGAVIRVADGDTINLEVDGQRERIRLANIDAPESYGRSDRPGQPYAEASADALAAMVADKTLTLHCFEQDHYGRHVCNIPLANGKTANEELVAQGLAWAYTGSNERYLRDKTLKQVQAKAKKAGLGLWQDKNPTAPWTWRSECWQKKRCN